MYNELINASQALSILAENALAANPEDQVAQLALELIDRLDELHEWVSGGGALPGQIEEVQHPAIAHICKAMQIMEQSIRASTKA